MARKPAKVKKPEKRFAAVLEAELPRDPPSPKGMTLASFFCCGGGIDLGFRSAGIETVFANDIDADACETFSRNLGREPLRRDIRGVGPSDYPKGAADVVTGGFPCVTFSMAGRRMGVTDDLNGKLYLELCRVIREIRPRYFVAENVEGILSANGGAAVKLVLAAFLRLGYRATYQLVNMAEHGVPQTRKRVIFVGVRLDQWRGSFRYPPKTRRLRADKIAPRWLPLARTLREAIGDLPPPGERLLGMMHGDAAEKVGKGTGVSGYHNSKPRGAVDPSHSQTTQGGVLLDEQDVDSHEVNSYGPRKLNVAMRRAAGGSPAPTVLSGAGSDAPWIAGGHDPNRAPISATHQMSKRVAHGGRRAPTVVSEATNVQPFISNGHEANDVPAYEFNQTRRGARDGSPAPTVATPKQNQPWIEVDKVVGVRNPDFFNPMRSAADPGPTMTSGGAAEDLGSGGGMRRMTVRECARVQTFPDWFEFPSSQAAGYKLVGNAVPPLYAKRLAEAILEYDARARCE